MKPKDDVYSRLLWELNKEKESKKELTDEDIKGDIAVRLRLYRDKNNLTQDELATRLGVSRRQVERWESRKYKPSNMAMGKMKEFGVI